MVATQPLDYWWATCYFYRDTCVRGLVLVRGGVWLQAGCDREHDGQKAGEGNQRREYRSGSSRCEPTRSMRAYLWSATRTTAGVPSPTLGLPSSRRAIIGVARAEVRVPARRGFGAGGIASPPPPRSHGEVSVRRRGS
mgnify:CR=1 FL=1